MVKQFVTPFAEDGDRVAVPDAAPVDGSVSYESGYGFDYQRPKGSSPLAKDIERQKLNTLLNDITGVLRQLQQNGAPEWSELQAPYSQFARVEHEGSYYFSAVAANESEPGVDANWVEINEPARTRKNNTTATTNPTTSDDSGDGYEPLSLWINTSTSEVFTCISASVGAAVWALGTLTVDELGTAALLDATTVGEALIELTNPSAVRYLRINADNSVTTLTAAQLRTDLGVFDLSATPEKDFDSSTTTPDGIYVRSRLWVNAAEKTAIIHFVIKGTATATIETNLGTISNNSAHGVDTFIDTGSGILPSSAKLIVPLYSNQDFTTGSIPAIVGAIKMDSNCNAWINLQNGANFSVGQTVTVMYKIK